MEQPWPPPGPWNLPRSEGEAEEESDLDVSPSSPRCPQLPGGGAQMYSHGIEMACQKQKEFVKSSVACKWNLAEAQQKLGNLALHNSESLDQEHAKAQTAVSELRQREEEWRQKEEALVQRERMCLWNVDAISKDVFNKSFINQGKRKETEDDKSESFMQKYEQKIRHFGMLSRWDDSQRFLSDHPYLVCEETAKYLILWCFHLEAEQKGALMEQIAHQAVVMQFIMEMAKNCNVDPRGCFRLFFQKAKAEEEGYFEAFKNELEAFKSRVRLYSQSSSFQPMTIQNHVPHSGVGSIGLLESLPQKLKINWSSRIPPHLCLAKDSSDCKSPSSLPSLSFFPVVSHPPDKIFSKEGEELKSHLKELRNHAVHFPPSLWIKKWT
ncbi:hsp90 co-chaperone Cdc37-like 1 isoform X1 [Pteropus medius]|uniref:Hsp90 co-chaperone Cdc37-like 1 n=1 Tax=Pteropus vampyrus TaxID=132908 RepID=A0A6P3R3Y5_PTEVA|nr:hsp90 co-chaperone Cdc37-like 1 isoform X1 [Pteropus vampyrus]XP_039740305.1 hsp90 co-chaperone Cdc37-like 1 isoform X1 [Pteropus giganteus]